MNCVGKIFKFSNVIPPIHRIFNSTTLVNNRFLTRSFRSSFNSFSNDRRDWTWDPTIKYENSLSSSKGLLKIYVKQMFELITKDEIKIRCNLVFTYQGINNDILNHYLNNYRAHNANIRLINALIECYFINLNFVDGLTLDTELMTFINENIKIYNLKLYSLHMTDTMLLNF